jgi:hypothetical protein
MEAIIKTPHYSSFRLPLLRAKRGGMKWSFCFTSRPLIPTIWAKCKPNLSFGNDFFEKKRGLRLDQFKNTAAAFGLSFVAFEGHAPEATAFGLRSSVLFVLNSLVLSRLHKKRSGGIFKQSRFYGYILAHTDWECDNGLLLGVLCIYKKAALITERPASFDG